MHTAYRSYSTYKDFFHGSWHGEYGFVKCCLLHMFDLHPESCWIPRFGVGMVAISIWRLTVQASFATLRLALIDSCRPVLSVMEKPQNLRRKRFLGTDDIELLVPLWTIWCETIHIFLAWGKLWWRVVTYNEKEWNLKLFPFGNTMGWSIMSHHTVHVQQNVYSIHDGNYPCLRRSCKKISWKSPCFLPIVPQAFEPPLTHKGVSQQHIFGCFTFSSSLERGAGKVDDPLVGRIQFFAPWVMVAQKWKNGNQNAWYIDAIDVYMFVCFVDIPSGFVNAYCWPLNPLICHSKISHLAEPNRGILRRSSSIPPPQPRAINWTLKIWASWVTVGDIGALEAWWLLPLPIWFFWELKKGGFLVIQNSLSPSVLVKTRIPKINWAYGFIEMVVFLDLLKGSFVKGLSFNDLQWDNQRILFGKIGACNLEMHPGLLPTMRIIPYCTKPLS